MEPTVAMLAAAPGTAWALSWAVLDAASSALRSKATLFAVLPVLLWTVWARRS